MFIIQEIQTNGGVSALTPAITKDDKNQALSAFFTTCASACISNVEVHTVTLTDEHGQQVRPAEYFEHPQGE